ncbi:MAG: hypothetical protein GY842_17765 [bacterium]|nr:hypothetical protein [bacterium]
MKHVVKGSPLGASATEVSRKAGTCGRCSVGLFGGSGFPSALDSDATARVSEPPPFPPHTIVTLVDPSRHGD